MFRALARLDDAIERVERFAIIVMLAVMSLAVALDVVHRVASSPGGIVTNVLLRLAGSDPSPETQAFVETWGAGLVHRLLTMGILYAALRTANGSTLTRARAAVYAAVGAIGLGFAVQALLWLVPNGFIWSQPLALGLLLWVALLGATLATKARAHIVLEVANKLWPPGAQKYVRTVSGVVSAVFCAVLAVLSAYYTFDFYEQWQSGVGYVMGLRLPKWTMYAALPAGFTLMGLRFLAYAVGDVVRSATPAGEVQS